MLCDVSPDEMESSPPVVSPELVGRGRSQLGEKVPAAGNPGYRTQDCHSHLALSNPVKRKLPLLEL